MALMISQHVCPVCKEAWLLIYDRESAKTALFKACHLVLMKMHVRETHKMEVSYAKY